MRKSTRRVLALLSTAPAIAGSLVLAAPAAHAAPGCSTDLVAFNVAVVGDYRIAVGSPTSTSTSICVEAGLDIAAVVVFNTGTTVNEPEVVTDSGAGACDTHVFAITAPVQLSLNVGVSTAPHGVCVGSNGQWQSVALSTATVHAPPDVEVWIPANSFLAEWLCFALDPLGNWQTCAANDLQLV